jgi:integrase
MSELEPITPQDALNLYLRDREGELSKQTHRTHKSRLSYFLEWCDQNDIDDLNTLSGRDVRRYRIWRGDAVSRVTLKSYLDTLRVFLRWCETIDAVSEGLADKVQSPRLGKGENEKTVHIDTNTAERIIDHLRKYEYGTLPHVIWELIWHTGMRRGAVRGLDVDDYHSDESYAEVRHRPDSDTPLKNGNEGERPVALGESVCTVLDDWLADQRPAVTDDYGREPLLATQYGRVHGQTIQKWVYRFSRPCAIGNECPHDRDPDECDAATWNGAHECPSSIAPHDLRRSSITHALRGEVPKEAVSGRCDVSGDVLDAHYDQMTEREKMEQRRGFLGNL